MYSRSKDRPDYSIQPPRHYSGWAFPPPSKCVPPSDAPLAPTACALPAPMPHASIQDEKAEMPERKTDVSPSSSKPSPPPFLQPFQSLFGNLGNTFPFGHGLGFDEILILGLMILLAQNEHDPDILLLLGLLLFCG